jgi:hypothetical protein
MCCKSDPRAFASDHHGRPSDLQVVGGIACCFQVSPQRFQYIILLASFFFARLCGRFYRRGLYNFECLFTDCFVHWDPTEGNAASLAVIQPAASTGVA